MATNPFLGSLQAFPFGFAPKGWAQCNGQILPIAQNQALFSLLGTTYGGNGVTTFALPNLQGRVPVMAGGAAAIALGAVGGEETHTLVIQEVPAHQHRAQAVTSAANQGSAAAHLLATTAGAATVYGAFASSGNMNGASIGPFGGSQAHENRQPYLVLNWCIALVGIFPSRN
jgi:microcystin-dependent protein